MKKGFTLIELLAVIVILAIIALIATPIILGIINSTRVSANERSAELYIDAVEQAVVRKNLSGEFSPTQCTIENSVVTCDGEELNVAVDGEKPITGIIIFEDGLVKPGTTLNYKDFTATVNETNKLEIEEKIETGGTIPPQQINCTLTDSDTSGGVSLSDEVTCGTESFYVIPNDPIAHETAVAGTITLLAKYNLNVGADTVEGTLGIQNENATGVRWDSNGNVLIDICNFTLEEYDNYMDGVYEPEKYLSFYELGKGCNSTLPFSETNYWGSDVVAGTFIYNNNSSLYPYVENYGEYISNMGIDVKESSIATFNQINSIEDTAKFETSSFWLGTAVGETCSNCVYHVDKKGPGDDMQYYQFRYYGVRPVIIISETSVEI